MFCLFNMFVTDRVHFEDDIFIEIPTPGNKSSQYRGICGIIFFEAVYLEIKPSADCGGVQMADVSKADARLAARMPAVFLKRKEKNDGISSERVCSTGFYGRTFS